VVPQSEGCGIWGSYPIEELLDRSVIFEFDGLSRDLQNFLMETLFAYVFESRLAKNQRDSGLNHVFFLDEGKRVFSVYKERQDASGIPKIDELTAKMREFGEGLVVADQEASKLTDSIKANTATKVLLPTGDRKQFQAMTESMHLDEKQAEYAQQLDVGETIIQSGNSDPVPVQLDDYDLEKAVSDEALRQLQAKEWSQLSHEPRQQTDRFNEAMSQGADLEETEIPDDPDEEIDLSAEADQLLTDIVEHPFKPLTDRYTEFSSTGTAHQVKEELVEAGLVYDRNVKHGSTTRKLLDITDKARSYIETELDLNIDWPGKGGIVHRYWQTKLKEAFETAGWVPLLEKFDADIYVHLGACELMVELAMGKNERELDHVQEHLGSESKVVWLIARNSDIQEYLTEKLEECDVDTDRVAVHTLHSLSQLEIVPG